MSFISSLTPSFGFFAKRAVQRVGENATMEFAGKSGNILVKDVLERSIQELASLKAGSAELGRMGAYKLRAKAYYETLIKPILTAPFRLIRRIASMIRHPGKTLGDIRYQITRFLRRGKPVAAENAIVPYTGKLNASA